MARKELSLIIPLRNEAESILELITSIDQQTLQPDEVIFVDGGSTDKTVEIIESTALKHPRYKIIKTSLSSPGKGRNIGIEQARNEWVALTDAGIILKESWLENLSKEIEDNPDLDIVYGNYSPQTNTFFEKCAAISYVPPLEENSIRGKSVASLLLRKEVWEKVGGFPDLRAAEDLMFMEAVAKQNFKIGFAPKALVYWQLRPDLYSTFQKFVLYSKHNVWAGRTWDWHYGVLKQYIVILLFIILAFVNSWWWLVMPAIWLVLRTAKRSLAHKYEYGRQPLLNPVYFLSIMLIILVIDLATFIGWGQALLFKKT